MSFWTQYGKVMKGLLSFTGIGRLGSAIKGLFKGQDILDAVNDVDITPEDIESGKNQIFRGHLTGAEQEANAFNASEAQKQRDWEMQMDNTKYQRAVADASAAGINPMMIAGGSPSTPSGAAASSASSGEGFGLNLGSLLQTLVQAQLVPSQIEKNKADASKAASDAEKNQSDIKVNEQQIEESIARCKKIAEETENEVKRGLVLDAEKILTEAKTRLTDANEESVRALKDVQVAYFEASAGKAKAEAGLAYMNTMYQKGLIDNGMCEKVVKKIVSETNLADAQSKAALENALSTELKNAKRTGNYGDVIERELREKGKGNLSIGEGIGLAITWLCDEIKLF